MFICSQWLSTCKLYNNNFVKSYINIFSFPVVLLIFGLHIDFRQRHFQKYHLYDFERRVMLQILGNACLNSIVLIVILCMLDIYCKWTNKSPVAKSYWKSFSVMFSFLYMICNWSIRSCCYLFKDFASVAVDIPYWIVYCLHEVYTGCYMVYHSIQKAAILNKCLYLFASVV